MYPYIVSVCALYRYVYSFCIFVSVKLKRKKQTNKRTNYFKYKGERLVKDWVVRLNNRTRMDTLLLSWQKQVYYYDPYHFILSILRVVNKRF